MAERAGLSQPARLTLRAAMVVLLALPTLLGRVSSPLVLLLSLFVFVRPGLPALLRLGPQNRADRLFVAGFILIVLAALAAAGSPSDLGFIVNFLPFLLVPPLRRAFGSLNDPNPALRVGQLALCSAVASLAFALVQWLVLGALRPGELTMNAIQFANTAMLMGFLSLSGWFAPGPRRRWWFLLGPFAGMFAVLLSGTRGAVLAVPLLSVIAFSIELLRSPRRREIALWGLGILAGLALVVILAAALGFTRGLTLVSDFRTLVEGGAVDQSINERLTLYKAGIKTFWGSPFTGFGWGDLVTAVLPEVSPDLRARMSQFSHLHNGLLSFAIGSGAFGIVAFGLFSFAPALGLRDLPPDGQSAARVHVALTLVAAFQIFQLTNILLGYDFHTIQFVVVTALALGYMRDPESPAAAAAPKGGPRNHDRARRHRRNRRG